MRRLVVRGVGVVVVVAALAVVVLSLVHGRALRASAGRADDEAAATRERIETTAAALAVAERELLDARAVLQIEEHATMLAGEGRDAAAADRAEAAAQLDALLAELAGVDAAVTDTRYWADVNLLAIGGMESCLAGVSRFLNVLATGDSAGALRAAQDASGPCATVGLPFSAGGGR